MSSLTITNASAFYHRHERKVILAVIVIISIYLIAFLARMTWLVVPQADMSSTTSMQQTVNTSTPSNDQISQNSANIQELTKINLFGNADAKPAAVTKVEEVSDVPETRLNLLLSGVVASSESGKGAAIIQYQNKQNTYGIGDKIEGTNVTLDEIYSDRVIIKNRLTRETLMLDGIDFDEANRRRIQQAQDNSTNPRQADRRLTNQSLANQIQNGNSQSEPQPDLEAIREARERMAQSPESFAELISLSPHRVGNQLIGYRVSPGANAALFSSLGLKPGDVVTELNGLDLSDVQQSFEAISLLQEADTLFLEILRKGENVSLEFDIPGAE